MRSQFQHVLSLFLVFPYPCWFKCWASHLCLVGVMVGARLVGLAFVPRSMVWRKVERRVQNNIVNIVELSFEGADMVEI